MKSLAILRLSTVLLGIVLLCSCSISARRINRHGPYVHTRTNVSTTPCTPRHPQVCGERELLNEESESADGFGDNVCIFTKMYSAATYTYVQSQTYRCWGNRCRQSVTYCVRTSNCTGARRNFTQSRTDCCEGYAVDPDDVANSKWSHYWSPHWSRYNTLQDEGCNLELVDSVFDCLLQLDPTVESFLNTLLTDASVSLITALGSSSSEDSFTVFASSKDFEGSVLAHIVNGSVESKWLTHGTVLRTLEPNVFLHVGKVSKNVYVNGISVTDLDACQARNGRVHSVSDPIPSSNLTIAERLRRNPQLSTFLQLLDAANITELLDVANGKSRTLLAPTNEAFNKLPANAVDCLLSSENAKALSQLVLIHIGSPAEYTATLSQRSRFYTFNTRYYLFVREEDGNVLVTNDRIPLQDADIPANNGVIHTLPDVIVPPVVDFDTLSCPTAAPSEASTTPSNTPSTTAAPSSEASTTPGNMLTTTEVDVMGDLV